MEIGDRGKTCAVNSLYNTPGRLSERVERRTTDPLQRPVIHQLDEIEANGREIRDRERPDRSDRLAQGTGIATDGGDEKGEKLHSPSVCYHERGELFAEDVEQHLAVLPEVAASSTEMTIDDAQVGDPGVPLTEDQERLRQLIWKSKHLLIEKGNAVPPAARGAVCDIDVSDANPVAQTVRPVASKFRKTLANLIT